MLSQFRWRICAVVCTAAGLSGGNLSAQAVHTADSRAEVALFAAGTRVSTDFNSTNYGFTVGGQYTRFYRYVSPGLNLRYTHSSGTPVGETSYAIGPTIEVPYKRLHPYVDLLFGYGVVHYANTPASIATDNSAIHMFGAGMTYELTRRISLLGDGQYQYWKFGASSPQLTPVTISAGATYRFSGGFRKHGKVPPAPSASSYGPMTPAPSTEMTPQTTPATQPSTAPATPAPATTPPSGV